MKRRHPKQVVDHTAFRPGDEYSLIRVKSDASVSCESMTFVEALGNGEMPAAMDALGRHPAEDREIRFTTHDIHGEIIVASWRWNDVVQNKWVWADLDSGYIGTHLIFVPLGDWDADPRVHVVAWLNPDDVCEAGLTWAEEEAVLRRRRDAAMRKALGF